MPTQPLVLVSAPMQAVGRASYGLYLWQQLAFLSGLQAPLVFYLGAALLGGIIVAVSYTVSSCR